MNILDRRRFESAPTDSSSLGNPRKEFNPQVRFEFFKGIIYFLVQHWRNQKTKK
jgi:hypothetical protein